MRVSLKANRKDRVTFGVQGVVRDGRRVLLVRHGYRRGWYFPGGGLERGETALGGLLRELQEEVGVLASASPRLIGIYTHFDQFPGDHILLYLLETWTRPHIPAPTYEIEEARFFDVEALPDEVSKGTQRRIAEIFAGSNRSLSW